MDDYRTFMMQWSDFFSGLINKNTKSSDKYIYIPYFRMYEEIFMCENVSRFAKQRDGWLSQRSTTYTQA